MLPQEGSHVCITQCYSADNNVIKEQCNVFKKFQHEPHNLNMYLSIHTQTFVFESSPVFGRRTYVVA